MYQLKSRWANEVKADNVHREYPRPNFVRNSYFNLNGEWEYCINQSVTAEDCEDSILVPFSPESFLSGVQKRVMPGDFLHYKKIFTLPEGFKKERVLLHFGAVDQECIAFLNKMVVGTHKGGYLAFSFDVTDYLLEGENVLTLCVRDMTEKKPHARGKQKLEKGGYLSYLFYTPQSGIWKTVWMESVPENYIEKVKITPQYDEAAIEVHICTNGNSRKQSGQGEAHVRIFDRDIMTADVMIGTDMDAQIQLGSFKSWTPENPHLYDMEITYGEDMGRSYFGMRKFHIDRDSKGILRFFLNNKPYFFNGVLNQGYWPESLMTPPTDAALKYDIEKLKKLGFNMIRKHVKVESDRFYYHCDKTGMIVWQDMPNGGGDYNMVFVTYLPNLLKSMGRHVKDCHYGILRRKDTQGRTQYYRDLRGMIDQLYNYPCIAAWIPFNEGWGQFDAAKATELIRKCDKTRFVNEACGWFNQGGGDMYSIHDYSKNPEMKVKPQKNRVVALTEFGGYAMAVPGHCACEKKVGYRLFGSKKELTDNYKQLWEKKVYPNLAKGLSAAIYTQTSDIEEEVNGIFTYDRDKVKFIETELCQVNQKLYREWKFCLENSEEKWL